MIPPTVVGLDGRPFVVRSGAFEIAAWSWGEGPAVLLAHGWGGHAGQMCRLASMISAKGFRAVAFDMPAHGDSAGRETTVLDMARAVRAVADHVGPLEGVAAHSLGATATALALRDGLVAKRVVLLAPAAEPEYFARRAARHLGLTPERTEAMLAGIRRRVGRGAGTVAIPEIAPDLRTPALVLHDPADRDVPWAHGRAIARAWPGAELVAVRGLGHHRILGDADAVATATDFLAGVPRREIVGAERRLRAG